MRLEISRFLRISKECSCGGHCLSSMLACNRFSMLFVVAGGTSRRHCFSSMLDFDAICGVPEHLVILLFAFDAWFWCYLSWPDILLEVIAFLWCLILMLFVVAGGTFESHCLPSMLDFAAICGVPKHLAILLFAFDAWLWCYLSWPEVLLEVIAFLRCLTLTLFVVAGHTFGGHCFSLMLDSDAICRGRRYFWKSLLAFDAWIWCYLWCSRAFEYFIV